MKFFSDLIERLGKTLGFKSSPPEAHDEPTAPPADVPAEGPAQARG
jgi:hypothetical protein